MQNRSKRTISGEQQSVLLATLKERFEKYPARHHGLKWADVMARLEALGAEKAGEKLWSLNEMERTGGEPDMIGLDSGTGEYLFADCSQESPKGRRSCCYDQESLDSRKENKPAISAVGMAESMGLGLLTEERYRELQKLGEFDLKSSSWVLTPAEIRSRGGALFCDRRYNRVFTYHNGAESYYSLRGFRCLLKV